MSSGPIWPGAAAKPIFFHFRFHFCRLKRVLRAAQARYGKKWFFPKKNFFKNFFFQFYYFRPYLARGGSEINFPPDFTHYFNSIYLLLDFLSKGTACEFIQPPVKKICIFWPKMAKKHFFFQKLLKNINKYQKLWKFAENLDETQNWNFI